MFLPFQESPSPLKRSRTAGGDSVNDAGEFGGYWSRSRGEGYPGQAYCLRFRSIDHEVTGGDRLNGYLVRPVLVIPE